MFSLCHRKISLTVKNLCDTFTSKKRLINIKGKLFKITLLYKQRAGETMSKNLDNFLQAYYAPHQGEQFARVHYIKLNTIYSFRALGHAQWIAPTQSFP